MVTKKQIKQFKKFLRKHKILNRYKRRLREHRSLTISEVMQCCINTSCFSSAFTWHDTAEGRDFWCKYDFGWRCELEQTAK